jgi:hypothetical protein
MIFTQNATRIFSTPDTQLQQNYCISELQPFDISYASPEAESCRQCGLVTLRLRTTGENTGKIGHPISLLQPAHRRNGKMHLIIEGTDKHALSQI